MFTDPQSVTVNAVANSLPRTSSAVNAGTFITNDGTLTLTVSHAYGKRTRRLVKLTQNKIAPDPLVSANNIKYSMSVSVVVDVPITGFTVVEAKYVVDALTKWLTDSSGAKVTQLLGGEN